jgi:hypothetical protein
MLESLLVVMERSASATRAGARYPCFARRTDEQEVAALVPTADLRFSKLSAVQAL